MNIYEKNRALNVKAVMKEYINSILRHLEIPRENLYSNGEVFFLNKEERLAETWILTGKTPDFCVFRIDEEKEIENFLRFNITNENRIEGFLYEGYSFDEDGTRRPVVKKLESCEISEYNSRFFLNALYINGEKEGKENFNIDLFDFTLEQSGYFDYISYWNGNHIENEEEEL